MLVRIHIRGKGASDDLQAFTRYKDNIRGLHFIKEGLKSSEKVLLP